jgi:hypothetical protein
MNNLSFYATLFVYELGSQIIFPKKKIINIHSEIPHSNKPRQITRETILFRKAKGKQTKHTKLHFLFVKDKKRKASLKRHIQEKAHDIIKRNQIKNNLFFSWPKFMTVVPIYFIHSLAKMKRKS